MMIIPWREPSTKARCCASLRCNAASAWVRSEMSTTVHWIAVFPCPVTTWIIFLTQIMGPFFGNPAAGIVSRRGFTPHTGLEILMQSRTILGGNDVLEDVLHPQDVFRGVI